MIIRNVYLRNIAFNFFFECTPPHSFLLPRPTLDYSSAGSYSRNFSTQKKNWRECPGKLTKNPWRGTEAKAESHIHCKEVFISRSCRRTLFLGGGGLTSRHFFGAFLGGTLICLSFFCQEYVRPHLVLCVLAFFPALCAVFPLSLSFLPYVVWPVL